MPSARATAAVRPSHQPRRAAWAKAWIRAKRDRGEVFTELVPEHSARKSLFQVELRPIHYLGQGTPSGFMLFQIEIGDVRPVPGVGRAGVDANRQAVRFFQRRQ